MRRFLCLASVAFLLSACAAGTPIYRAQDAVPQFWHPSAGKSVVVMGVSAQQRRSGPLNAWPMLLAGWVAVGGQGASNPPMAVMNLSPLGYQDANATAGETAYLVFELPPGRYAFAWLERLQIGLLSRQHDFYTAARFPQMRVTITSNGGEMRTFGAPAAVDADAPSFELRPNEMLYVGDIMFDLRNESLLTWTQAAGNPTAAAAAILRQSEAPGDANALPTAPVVRALPSPLVVRPLTHLDGGPLSFSDHAPFTPLH